MGTRNLLFLLEKNVLISSNSQVRHAGTMPLTQQQADNLIHPKDEQLCISLQSWSYIFSLQVISKQTPLLPKVGGVWKPPLVGWTQISKRSITQKNQMKFRLTAMLCGMKAVLKDKNWSHQYLAFGISKWREIIWINYQMGNTLVMKVPLIGSSLRLIWKNGFGHSSNLTNKNQQQRLRYSSGNS